MYFQALHAANLNVVIQFLPTLLNQLFSLLPATTNDDVAFESIRWASLPNNNVPINVTNTETDVDYAGIIIMTYITSYSFYFKEQPTPH